MKQTARASMLSSTLVALLLSAPRCCTANSYADAGRFVTSFFGYSADPVQQEGEEAPNKLSLIGAGFARTGTKSTEAALAALGGYKVYDTRSMIELNRGWEWEEAGRLAKHEQNYTLLERLLEELEHLGYNATLDYPMNLLAPLLAARRPRAQVLMTVRPDNSAWVESWCAVNDILSIFVARPWKWLVDLDFPTKMVKSLYGFEHHYTAHYPEDISRPVPWWGQVHSPSKSCDSPHKMEAWIQLHEDFKQELTQQLGSPSAAPDSRFLVYSVQEGWGPLASFLSRPEPNGPFPSINDRESLKKIRMTMDVVACGLPLWLYLLGKLLLWGVKLLCCRAGKKPSVGDKKKLQ